MVALESHEAPTVAGSDVHVWWIDDSKTAGDLEPDETARAARFRSDADRVRFAARRGAARTILAAYARLEPAQIKFDRTCHHCGHPDHGRPRLLDVFDLSFSVASRPTAVIIAVATAGMCVGVDIETVARFDSSTIRDVRQVALTEDEQRSVGSADARGLARLWCRKEAVLKAMGLGLAGRPVHTVDVRRGLVEGWHLVDLTSPSHLVGAVAARARIDRVVRFEMPREEPSPRITPKSP